MTRQEFIDQVNATILSGVAGNVTPAKVRSALINLAESTAFTKADLGLSAVENTSDLAKPVSTATVTALAGKVDKVSGKGLSSEDFTSGEKTKLSGIATSATANSTDVQLRDRATHTGTQPANTITGLATVATTGAYTDITGRPTLGTAAALDAPASGNAASGQLVKGADTRLIDARTPVAHNHSAVDITSGVLAPDRLGSGVALQVVRRNAANTALEFANVSVGSGDMTRAVYDTNNDGVVDQAAIALAVAWANVTSKPTFSTVATTGAYSDLTGKPTLGTSAARNVGTLTGEVAAADDTRFHAHSNKTSLDKITESAGLPLWNGGDWPSGAGGGGDMYKSVYDVDNDGIVDVAESANAVTWSNVSSKPTFATVATSGAYADLTGKPALGTAALLNVAATGNAASGEVVKGNDTRLSDSRTPTVHNHAATEITSGVLAPDRLATGTALQVYRRNAANTAIECATISVGGGDMLKTENLSGLSDYGTARANLGLGGAATLSVGTSSGTVAAGNDSRIVAAVPNTRTISTTAPLTGGGDLTADRTLAISPATTSAPGSMSAADKTKLDGVSAGATANATDAQLRDRATHTGTQDAATLTGTLVPARLSSGSALQVFRRNAANDAIECRTLVDTDIGNATPTSIASAASITIDCTNRNLTINALAHDATFSTSNLAAGRDVNIRIVTGGATQALSFPVGWKWLGASPPANQGAGKSALLSLKIWGNTDADVQAAYAVQP